MKKKVAVPKDVPSDTNPFMNARRAWNEHTHGLMNAVRVWQIVAISSLLIALVAIGGTIQLASQSKFIPYVVEVDKLGRSAAVGIADAAAPADQRVIHASLAAFISNSRLITPDIALQKKAVFAVYALINPDDPAAAKMTQWYNGTPESDPFKRAAKQTVETEIVSVIPQSPDTWQVEWNEKTFDRQGVPIGQPYRMRALITVKIVPPTSHTTENEIRQNPLGIYVQDFNWSKQT